MYFSRSIMMGAVLATVGFTAVAGEKFGRESVRAAGASVTVVALTIIGSGMAMSVAGMSIARAGQSMLAEGNELRKLDNVPLPLGNMTRPADQPPSLNQPVGGGPKQ